MADFAAVDYPGEVLHAYCPLVVHLKIHDTIRMFVLRQTRLMRGEHKSVASKE